MKMQNGGIRVFGIRVRGTIMLGSMGISEYGGGGLWGDVFARPEFWGKIELEDDIQGLLEFGR